MTKGKPAVNTRSRGRRVLAYADSQTMPGVKYAIALEGDYVCSCPDNLNRQRDCKHMQAFFAGEIPERRAPIREIHDRLRNAIQAQVSVLNTLAELVKR